LLVNSGCDAACSAVCDGIVIPCLSGRRWGGGALPANLVRFEVGLRRLIRHQRPISWALAFVLGRRVRVALADSQTFNVTSTDVRAHQTRCRKREMQETICTPERARAGRTGLHWWRVNPNLRFARLTTSVAIENSAPFILCGQFRTMNVVACAPRSGAFSVSVNRRCGRPFRGDEAGLSRA
jgi:hypothetical protein